MEGVAGNTCYQKAELGFGHIYQSVYILGQYLGCAYDWLLGSILCLSISNQISQVCFSQLFCGVLGSQVSLRKLSFMFKYEHRRLHIALLEIQSMLRLEVLSQRITCVMTLGIRYQLYCFFLHHNFNTWDKGSANSVLESYGSCINQKCPRLPS